MTSKDEQQLAELCNALTPCPLYGTDPTLVVGGNLTWTDGSNFSGNTVLTPSGIYSATSVAYQNANSHLQPMRRSGLNEDIETAFAYFRSAAKQWTNFTSLPNTTTIINCNGNVFMIGLNQDINIFRINATQVAPTGNVIGTGNNTFDTLSSLTIIAPDNSTILINVNGANIDFGNYAISRNTV
ncbi:MAG: conserved repeat domain protein, partial [Herbinix sp.]|nr:conserved repeat domain protein [Herbinix sp.]